MNTILVFDKCEKRRCVNITVNNDMTLEQWELFSVTIDLSTEHTSTINIDIVTTKIEIWIMDDDNQCKSLCSRTITMHDTILQ